jgi:biopolymer transport protein ExbB
METVAVENPYGLAAALEQGGIIAQSVFGILVFMSLVSWFIIITKYIDQRKVLTEAPELEKKFWGCPGSQDRRCQARQEFAVPPDR